MKTKIKARATTDLIIEGAKLGSKKVRVVFKPLKFSDFPKSTHHLDSVKSSVGKEGKKETFDLIEDSSVIVDLLKNPKDVVSIDFIMEDKFTKGVIYHTIESVEKQGYKYTGKDLKEASMYAMRKLAEELNYKYSDLHASRIENNRWGVFVKKGAKKGFKDGAILPSSKTKTTTMKQTKKGIKQDKGIKALKAGKRYSNITGKPYYENRPNRSDKSLVAKLENGGNLDEKYKVVKVFRKSGTRKTLKTNLSREEAMRVVNSYPNSNTSMITFTKMLEKGGNLIDKGANAVGAVVGKTLSTGITVVKSAQSVVTGKGFNYSIGGL